MPSNWLVDVSAADTPRLPQVRSNMVLVIVRVMKLMASLLRLFIELLLLLEMRMMILMVIL